ncbi:MAG: SDR family NAD(P)-dependent oxidoreductase [Bacteroidales bacterium]
MARIFITGSTDGLGFLAAHQLIAKGHEVVFHARNHERAKETSTRIPKNARILVADLASSIPLEPLPTRSGPGSFDVLLQGPPASTEP